jgi:hypothetical protein
MHMTDLASVPLVPFPQHFDQYFPPSFPFLPPGQTFRDANSDQIEGIVFPEATSAWHLSFVLQLLANPQLLTDPTLPGYTNPKELSTMIADHAKDIVASKWRAGNRNAALGTDFM